MDSLDLSSIIRSAGGLGLFLLGMTVMTDALRQLAGASIRGALMRFTRSPISGALTGAASTALLQSSSATTVAAVGFVAAGLMRFESALGIVFGANLGTTVTGWLVMIVGFKLDLLSLMLPCVFVGMLIKLLGSGRTAAIGLAITGFGVIFVGIDQMQIGMSSLHGLLDGLRLEGDGWLDRLGLVLLGTVFTGLTQSSSAGVAAVLTAMHAEAISLGQGLALVIGMDVGTTITAILATIGGSPASRRTGTSHFVYNVVTAILAFALVTPYLALVERWTPAALVDERQLVLVAFHTGFNLLGVVAVLPFARQFAALMLRIVPERDGGYAKQLDPSLLSEPVIALDALSSTLSLLFTALLRRTRGLLGRALTLDPLDLLRIRQALDEASDYADAIALDAGDDRWRQLVDCLHVLDHLKRLHERCDEDVARARHAARAPELSESHHDLVSAVGRIEACLPDDRWTEAREAAQARARAISSRVGSTRSAILVDVARDELDVDEATASLESMRWLSRVANHLAQITEHLQRIHEPEARDEAADEAQAP